MELSLSCTNPSICFVLKVVITSFLTSLVCTKDMKTSSAWMVLEGLGPGGSLEAAPYFFKAWNTRKSISISQCHVIILEDLTIIQCSALVNWMQCNAMIQCSTLPFHGTLPNAHFEKIRTSNTQNSCMMTGFFPVRSMIMWNIMNQFSKLRPVSRSETDNFLGLATCWECPYYFMIKQVLMPETVWPCNDLSLSTVMNVL